jgi:hypothetical protein
MRKYKSSSFNSLLTWFNCSFFAADHSRAALNVSQKMLLRLLSFHQVMPEYLDSISVFGQAVETRGMRFSGFADQINLSPIQHAVAADALGRSGRFYEICYNLRSVSSWVYGEGRYDVSWNINQAALYHQFDVIDGRTLWISTRGSQDIRQRVERFTSKRGRPENRSYNTLELSLKSSLATHLMLCQWATEPWLHYIQWLDDKIYTEVSN